jgi:hypothetical protein
MDGGLRQLFRKHIKSAQWTSIESGQTERGIPDSEFCFPGGIQGWIEYKQTKGWMIPKTKSWPFQVAWIDRRARLGGRVFIAVRRIDELWLYHGRDAKYLKIMGLKTLRPLLREEGGPERWDWGAVERILKKDQ